MYHDAVHQILSWTLSEEFYQSVNQLNGCHQMIQELFPTTAASSLGALRPTYEGSICGTNTGAITMNNSLFYAILPSGCVVPKLDFPGSQPTLTS